MAKIVTHNELDVYRLAFESAMQIYELSKSFPKDEKFALTDQVRRSSRSVAANLAEVWRKRRYEAAFIAKLSDSEAEAAETQVWLEFAVKCKYIQPNESRTLYTNYNSIIKIIITMINHPENWIITK